MPVCSTAVQLGAPQSFPVSPSLWTSSSQVEKAHIPLGLQTPSAQSLWESHAKPGGHGEHPSPHSLFAVHAIGTQSIKSQSWPFPQLFQPARRCIQRSFPRSKTRPRSCVSESRARIDGARALLAADRAPRRPSSAFAFSRAATLGGGRSGLRAGASQARERAAGARCLIARVILMNHAPARIAPDRYRAGPICGYARSP